MKAYTIVWLNGSIDTHRADGVCIEGGNARFYTIDRDLVGTTTTLLVNMRAVKWIRKDL